MATTTDYDARRVSDNDTPDKSSLRELAPACTGPAPPSSTTTPTTSTSSNSPAPTCPAKSCR